MRVEGISVELAHIQSDTDQVTISMMLECDRLIPRCVYKTLTLEQLKDFAERLLAIHDHAVGEQRLTLAAAPDAVVEKVAGRYTAGSGV